MIFSIYQNFYYIDRQNSVQTENVLFHVSPQGGSTFKEYKFCDFLQSDPELNNEQKVIIEIHTIF